MGHVHASLDLKNHDMQNSFSPLLAYEKMRRPNWPDKENSKLCIDTWVAPVLSDDCESIIHLKVSSVS